MQKKLLKTKEKNIYLYAFLQTVPVLLGYIFLGITFGIMLQDAGYNYIWAFCSSLFIYAGSMQFVLVTLLSGAQSLFHTFIMTLFINGRHIFYGLSFLEKYRKMGKAYPYMVLSLTDETYSVLCNLKVPEGMDEKKLSFLISFFDHLYWITGSVIGAVIGQLITINTKGIDFSMTALFVVIVVNQWMENKNHLSALIGFFVALLSLFLFGPDKFLLPALFFIVLLLVIFHNRIEPEKSGSGEEAAS